MINFKYLFNFGSCGYYCLKHVIGKVTVNNKKYLSLYDIGEVLKNNNYSCLCVRLNKINDILFECITLLKVNSSSYHYVVLKRMSEKYIYFYDPLFLFIRRIRIEQFERKWSKVCLFYTKV